MPISPIGCVAGELGGNARAGGGEGDIGIEGFPGLGHDGFVFGDLHLADGGDGAAVDGRETGQLGARYLKPAAGGAIAGAAADGADPQGVQYCLHAKPP